MNDNQTEIWIYFRQVSALVKPDANPEWKRAVRDFGAIDQMQATLPDIEGMQIQFALDLLHSFGGIGVEAIAIIKRVAGRKNVGELIAYAEVVPTPTDNDKTTVIAFGQLERSYGGMIVVHDEGIPYLELVEWKKRKVKLL